MQRSPFSEFLAVFFAIIFVLTAVISLLWVSLDRELLTASTYKNALADQQVYTRLPGLVAEQLVLGLDGTPCSNNPLRCGNAIPELKACFEASLGQKRYNVIAAGVEQPTSAENQKIQACIDRLQPDVQTANHAGDPLSFFRSIKARDLEKVIAPLLPADQVRPLADSYLDQLFPYLNGKQDAIRLDLTGIKKSLASPGGLDTLLRILRAQPTCTLQQLEQLFVIAVTGQGTLFLCDPSPDLLNLLTPFIDSQLQAAVSLIPDIETLKPLEGGTSRSFGPFGTGLLGAIRLGLTLLRLSPLLPLLCLLLITLLVVRTLKDFLQWWGIPLFAAGLLLVILGLVSSGLFEPAWVGLLTGRVPASMSIGLVGTVHDLLQAVMLAYWRGLELLGGALALPGLIMWIASAFIHPEFLT